MSRKTLLQRIEELEQKGWIYNDKFIINTNVKYTLTQVIAMVKGNEYRIIKNDKISKSYKIHDLKTCLDNNWEY